MTTEQTGDQSSIKARRLDYASMLQRQVDRILFLRTTGQDWSEALEALADAMLPLADKQFTQEWEDRRVAGVRRPDGSWRLCPTKADQRTAFRLLMGLLGRREVLVEERRTSWAR